MASCGFVRRSVRLLGSHSMSLGECPDSSTDYGASVSGSGTFSCLDSTFSSYALGNLSSSEFSQLVRNTAFIFSDIEEDHEYICCKELDRTRSLGI